jgi:hypothetical protein
MPPRIFICNNRGVDGTNIREAHRKNVEKELNNAYFCKRHKKLNFKKTNANGLDKHLLRIIQAADSTALTKEKVAGGFTKATNEQTCCADGVSYQGYIGLDNDDEVIRFLKRFFTVLPCKLCFDGEQEKMQKHIDAIVVDA